MSHAMRGSHASAVEEQRLHVYCKFLLNCPASSQSDTLTAFYF